MIFLIILILILVFWIAPCIVMTLCLFYGHWDEAGAMNKAYYVPLRNELDEAISFLESLQPQRISISAHDDIELSARWFNHGSGKTVILAHGFNASAYSNCSLQAKWFWGKGFNLLLIDQRAHGRSGGKATTFGLLEQHDLHNWMQWCKSNTPTEKIICYGVSMGSAAVALSSVTYAADGMDLMVLDCGFSSLDDQMESFARKTHIPWKLMSPLVKLLIKLLLHCDTGVTIHEVLEKTSVPAFFFHGTADTVVSLEQGVTNYTCCRSPKDAFFTESADHTTAFAVGGIAAQKRLDAFLEKYFV